MHVLMFCPQFHPLVGGMERHALSLATALVTEGCRVTVLTPKLRSESADRETLDGVAIERFRLTDLARRIRVPGIALLNIPYIVWQVMRAVRPRLRGVDVLHCQGGCLQLVGAALSAHAAGIPIACMAGTASVRSDLGQIEASGRSGWIVARLVRAVVPDWIAASTAVREALGRAGIEDRRVVVIPYAVDAPASPAPLQRGARHFLFLARLASSANRDIPTLIEAFEVLAAKFEEVELALVGGGDLLEATRDRAKAGSAAQRIHVPGFDDPARWLSWADAFVLPSRREGLSVAMLEAMAAGRACIANDIPPNREALADGEAGILVPVGDRDALAAAMNALVCDAALTRRLGEAARQRFERHYSIEDVTREHVAFYRRLVACKDNQ